MKSFKIRLELNNKQSTLARKSAGVARHAYNWGVALCKEKFENKEKIPSAIDLHKQLVATVKVDNAWYYDVSKCSPQQALRDLDTSYKNFHRKQKKSGYKTLKYKLIKGVKTCIGLEGLPQFKKKGQRDSFYLDGAIHVKDNKIKLPKFGWLKCSELLPNVTIKSVVISRVADEWFVAFKTDIIVQHTIKTKGCVGVDLGIKTLATLSDGIVFSNPKPYKKAKVKLKKAQRIQSKRFVKTTKNQSSNYKKISMKVAKIHQKVANARKDNLHKITTYLTKSYQEIVIEDLNISGMVKNRKLASAILDGGFSEFRRQLNYKSKWYGSTITIVDRFYPSSKLCSACGIKKDKLKLSERTYNCQSCGVILDRDLNASLNLMKNAVSYTV
jgi:putative transposase